MCSSVNNLHHLPVDEHWGPGPHHQWRMIIIREGEIICEESQQWRDPFQWTTSVLLNTNWRKHWVYRQIQNLKYIDRNITKKRQMIWPYWPHWADSVGQVTTVSSALTKTLVSTSNSVQLKHTLRLCLSWWRHEMMKKSRSHEDQQWSRLWNSHFMAELFITLVSGLHCSLQTQTVAQTHQPF